MKKFFLALLMLCLICDNVQAEQTQKNHFVITQVVEGPLVEKGKQLALIDEEKVKINLTQKEQAWIDAHPQIVLGSDMGWSPQVILNPDGSISGIEADILGRINDLTGLNLQITLGKWKEIQEQARRKEIDGLATATYQKAREPYFLFSDSPYSMHKYIFTRHSDLGLVKDMSSLAGKRLAYIRGNMFDEKTLARYPDIQGVPQSSHPDSLEALIRGEVDAVMGGLNFQYLLRERIMTEIKLALVVPDSELKLLYCIRKDWPELHAIMNKALAAIPFQERLAIVERHSGVTQRTLPPKGIQLIQEEMQTVLKSKIDNIKQISRLPEIIEAVAQQNARKQHLDQIKKIDEKWKSTKELTDLKKSLQESSAGKLLKGFIFEKDSIYNEAFITDMQGANVAAFPPTSDYWQGDETKFQASFNNGNGKVYVGPIEYDESSRIDAIQISVPIIEKGATIGVLITGVKINSVELKILNALSRDEMELVLKKWTPLLEIEPGTTATDKLAVPEQVDFNKNTYILKRLAVLFAFILTVLIITWLVRGRPKQPTIRELLFLISFVFAGLIISIGVFVTILADGIDKESSYDDLRNRSHNLAFELKQSSDDLTRFVRTFAVTGDPVYEEHFKTILAIRNGNLARPKEYNNFYWDYVAAGHTPLTEDGEQYGIEEKIIELGLTRQEQEKLSLAKQESDALVELETRAFNTVRGLYKDGDGNYTVLGETDLELAQNILHGKEYHEAKARIMKPIDEFITLLNWRITNEQNLIQKRNLAIMMIITVLTMTTILFSVYVFFLLRRRVVTPLIQLQTGVQAIEDGHYAHLIDIFSQDEVGALASAFNSMAGSIEERTAELKEAQEHFQKLLEAAPDGFLAIDTTGKIVLANAGVEKLFGYSKEQMIGSKIEMLIPAAIRETHPPKRDAYFSDSRIQAAGSKGLELEAQHADGKVFPIEMTLSPIQSRQGMLAIAAIRDITERRLAEEAVLESEAKFRKLFESSRDAVLVLEENRFVDCNQSALEMYGFESKEELLALHPADASPLLQPNGQTSFEVAQKRFEEAFQGRTKPFEWVYTRKDGTKFLAEVVLSPTEFKGRQAFQAMARDITERKLAEEELLKLSQAIDQSSVSVVITDTHGIIEYVNPKFCEVTGYTSDEAIGKSPNILKSDNQPPELYKKLWDTIKSGRTWHGEMVNKRKNDEIFWENVTISPIRRSDGEITHFVAVKEDITAKREVNQDLKKRVEELAELRSSMLNMMEDSEESRKEAEEATKAKSDFLANMSHEIRTPMNAIIGMSHLALKTELTPKQHDYISIVQSASKALLGIINDILDFSKIEAGKLDMEIIDFDLNDVMHNLLNIISVKTQGKELELVFDLHPDTPTLLKGDSLRLGQILVNLTNNAVKFTEKGEIVVSVVPVQIEDDQALLKFSVQDTGIGLTEEQQEGLFQSFHQADTSTTRKFGGTGLGLTISKKLAEMMDGEIGVNSEPGIGSTFFFTARFRRHKKSILKERTTPESLIGLKVLIVDDNDTSSLVMQGYLKEFGFAAELIESGAKAIQLLKETGQEAYKPFDLILMDWQMPDMDGIETSRQIQKFYGLKHAPKIILITGFGQEDIMEQAEDISLDGFLLKPVNQSLLFDTIMEAFGQEIEHIANHDRRKPIIPKGFDAVRGAQVLLVEDNEINQQVAAELLEGEGFFVTIAGNGQIAVNNVQESTKGKHFDIVLMDLQMPIMDGYTTTKKIRENERFNDLPIIAMTADAMSGVQEKVAGVGMNDYLTKPIDPGALFRTLAKWIEPGKRELPSEYLANEKAPKSQEKIFLFDKVEGINVKDGLRRVGGKKKIYINLLKRFCDSQGDVDNRIKIALDTNDLPLAERLVHTVKGVSGNIGAMELHKVSESLETAIRSNDKVTIPKVLNLFSEQLSRLLLELEKVIFKSESVTNSAKKVQPVSIEELQPLLKKLHDLLADYDGEAEDYLEEIADSVQSAVGKSKFKRLKDDVSQFAFDLALEDLRQISNDLNISIEE